MSNELKEFDWSGGVGILEFWNFGIWKQDLIFLDAEELMEPLQKMVGTPADF